MRATVFSASSLRDQVLALIERTRGRSAIVQRIERPASLRDRWLALREFYRRAEPEICAQPAHVWGIDPYEVDWIGIFTPIEFGMWQNIRHAGAVFYPQYPVGRYFVDFANPVAMVAIECDGARWHTDKERDASRDREMEALGWTIYRFTGRECLEPDEKWDDEAGEYRAVADGANATFTRIVRSHQLATWAVVP